MMTIKDVNCRAGQLALMWLNKTWKVSNNKEDIRHVLSELAAEAIIEGINSQQHQSLPLQEEPIYFGRNTANGKPIAYRNRVGSFYVLAWKDGEWFFVYSNGEVWVADSEDQTIFTNDVKEGVKTVFHKFPFDTPANWTNFKV